MGIRNLIDNVRMAVPLDRIPRSDAGVLLVDAALANLQTAVAGTTAAQVAAATRFDLRDDLALKCGFLGTSGITHTLTSTANSTTAVYYQVPAGKVAYIRRLKGDIFDTTASAANLTSNFGAQSSPSSGNGLRIRTVETDTTTTLETLAASIENNLTLLFITGSPTSNFTSASGANNLLFDWKFSEPICLTAGQRFEVKHLAAVAYTIGVWAIEYSEIDA